MGCCPPPSQTDPLHRARLNDYYGAVPVGPLVDSPYAYTTPQVVSASLVPEVYGSSYGLAPGYESMVPQYGYPYNHVL